MILSAVSKMILEDREFHKADKTMKKVLMKTMKSRISVFERHYEKTRVRYD